MKRLLLVAAVAAVAAVAVVACAHVVDVDAFDADASVYVDDDYAAVLAEFVDDDGNVDYAGLAARPARLRRFLARLVVQGPTSTPALFPTADDVTAYSINAYNACVLAGVVERWPIASVNPNVVGGASFFYGSHYVVDGKRTSLQAYENDVVRKRGDPRVHFALNCASRGCPKLPATPFHGATLGDELARETARFLAEPRNVSVDVDGALVVSQIFEWFPEDFGIHDDVGVADALRRLAPDLAVPPQPVVRYRPWDWSINAR